MRSLFLGHGAHHTKYLLAVFYVLHSWAGQDDRPVTSQRDGCEGRAVTDLLTVKVHLLCRLDTYGRFLTSSRGIECRTRDVAQLAKLNV